MSHHVSTQFLKIKFFLNSETCMPDIGQCPHDPVEHFDPYCANINHFTSHIISNADLVPIWIDEKWTNVCRDICDISTPNQESTLCGSKMTFLWSTATKFAPSFVCHDYVYHTTWPLKSHATYNIVLIQQKYNMVPFKQNIYITSYKLEAIYKITISSCKVTYFFHFCFQLKRKINK